MDAVGGVLGILVTVLLTVSGLLQGYAALLSLLERVRKRRKPTGRGKPGATVQDKQPLLQLTQRGVIRFLVGVVVFGTALAEIQPLSQFYASFPGWNLWDTITVVVPYLVFWVWYPVALAWRGHKWLLRIVILPLFVEVIYANLGFFEPAFYETSWYLSVGSWVHALCYALLHTGLVLYMSLEFIGPWVDRLPAE